MQLTSHQRKKTIIILAFLHIFVIAISNYLVNFPFEVFGYQNTWGALSFPLIYLATDLTVRIFGRKTARVIIFNAMLPALIISYVLIVIFHEKSDLVTFNLNAFRVAFASFSAYLIGQLCDITVFAKLRKMKAWIAPSASTIFGNLVDTIVFFSVAFYASENTFMATHWPQIAIGDYCFKLLISLGLFLPAYLVLLNAIQEYILKTNSINTLCED